MFILTKAECDANESNLEAFKAQVQYFQRVYANSAENLALDNNVDAELNAVFTMLSSLTTCYKHKKKIYAIDIAHNLLWLQQTQKMLEEQGLEKTSGLTAAQKVMKRDILQRVITCFNVVRFYRPTYHAQRKYKIIATMVAALLLSVMGIAFALPFILGAVIMPASIIILPIIGIISAGLFVGVGFAVYQRLINKIQRRDFNRTPFYQNIFSLNKKFYENIHRQKDEFTEQVALEKFYESDQGKENSTAYQQLKQKRDNKFAALNEDLENAKKEKEAINEAYIATLTLIKDNIKPDDLLTTELEIKATGRSTNPASFYLENRFQQEVAKKLCAKKIAMLETAIELHQGDQTIVAKYEKYRANKKMNIQTDAAHYTEKRKGSLFSWQENKQIQKTSSKMVDKVVSDFEAEAIAEVAECRKTWF